jgi:N-carbamoylputrescine amidase
MSFTVALLQLASHGLDQEANKRKGEEFCRAAAELGADAALFPELWNIGFAYGLEDEAPRDAWKGWAIDTDSEFVGHFRALARELGIAIAITYLQSWEPAPRNVVSVIDRHGEIVFTYAKVHTCDFSTEAAHHPGESFEVGMLETMEGPIQVGAMICYDREYPESARVLMLKGAEIILTPNASTLDELNLSVFQARAYENLVGVAMTNYAAPQNNGHSVAYDPISHPEEDGPLRDTLVVRAGEAEGIYLASFNVQAIREYRQRETLGNAYRKPRTYTQLTSAAVAEPFIRGDARR